MISFRISTAACSTAGRRWRSSTRDRPAVRGAEPRLEPDRPDDFRHFVRALSRSRQARADRRALHRPRKDHDDRRAGRAPAAPRRMGDGEGEDRSDHGARLEAAAGTAETRSANGKVRRRARQGGGRARRVHRPAVRIAHSRPGLRLGQFPLSGPAGRQGHRVARDPRLRDARTRHGRAARRAGNFTGSRSIPSPPNLRARRSGSATSNGGSRTRFTTIRARSCESSIRSNAAMRCSRRTARAGSWRPNGRRPISSSATRRFWAAS